MNIFKSNQERVNDILKNLVEGMDQIDSNTNKLIDLNSDLMEMIGNLNDRVCKLEKKKKLN